MMYTDVHKNLFPVNYVFQFTEEKNSFSLRLSNWFHNPYLSGILLEFLHKHVVFCLQPTPQLCLQYTLEFNLSVYAFVCRLI